MALYSQGLILHAMFTSLFCEVLAPASVEISPVFRILAHYTAFPQER
jgi:hypothetical protein